MQGCRSTRTARSAIRSARPSRSAAQPGDALRFVVQRHAARSLHYDFRLERDGVLLSWAVPKGVPLALGERHLAVHVEDHPLDYGDFEGEIPAGQYGAGTVEIWDRGTYELVEEKKDGGLTVHLHGKPPRRALDARARPPRREGEELAPAAQGRQAPRRATYAPMLATATDVLPIGEGWAFEPKWDGFRALARVDGGVATFRSRNDNDLTTRFAARRAPSASPCARRRRCSTARSARSTRRAARGSGCSSRAPARSSSSPSTCSSGTASRSSTARTRERREALEQLVDTSVDGVLVSPVVRRRRRARAGRARARARGRRRQAGRLALPAGPPLDGLAQAEAEEQPGARGRRLHARPGPPLERDRRARARRPRRRRAALRGQRRHRLHRPRARPARGAPEAAAPRRRRRSPRCRRCRRSAAAT